MSCYRPQNRLRDKEAFQEIFSSKRRLPDKQFVFIAKKNGYQYARLGLAVPKRHIQSAVKRNRIKRVIRESFRLRKNQLKGFDLVVLVRRPIKNLKKEYFDEILDKNWQRIKCEP